MASLLPVSVRGKKYWRIVESRRVNGKPRPVPICYLGTVENILEVFRSVKDKGELTACSKKGTTEPPGQEAPSLLSAQVEAPQGQAQKRLDKTLKWLHCSRDEWKRKCQDAKTQLKIKTLGMKRLKESREGLKSKLMTHRAEVVRLQGDFMRAQNEVEELRKRLKATEEELINVKKK